MIDPTTLLAAGAGLLGLAAAHLLFWRWRLLAPAREDELLHTRAADSWPLALGHCRPGAPAATPPVLLIHGIAMNRQAFEFGVPRYALAASLASAGLDCFSLDLRGHGASRRRGPRSPRRFSLDTYLDQDLPAALDAIRDRTGAAQAMLVGHSQGALLALAAAARFPRRVAAVAALAPPLRLDPAGPVQALARLRPILGWPLTRRLAQALAPFAGPWLPAPAALALNARNVESCVHRRLLFNVVENLPPGVLDQFGAFLRDGAFRSVDGAVDHLEGMGACRQPALFVAAPRDGLAPPAVVASAHARWGGPKRLVVLPPEYGHTDLLLGRRAPEEVYPVIAEFLLRARPAASAAAAARRE